MPNNAVIEFALQQPAQSTIDFPWWSWPTDEFAAWGQWMGGIGAIGAVITTLWIMRRDRRKHLRGMRDQAQEARVAQEAARHEDLERHAGRARAVVAGPRYEPIAESNAVCQPPPYAAYGLEIANYSASPVLEVVLESVELLAPGGEVHEAWAAQDDALEDLPQPVAAVIAPGEARFVNRFAICQVWPHVKSGQGLLQVTFTFLDIEGYRWRRVGSEAPQLIKGTAPSA